MNKSSIPNHSWTRNFSTPDPSKSIHTFSRPPILEALNLLPVAFRVGSYINSERSNGREPIFDLNGIGLEPPNPGPHGGCPCGGLGGGAIGRGFRGDFRRWSLFPGRYIHRQVEADQFSLRIKRTSTNGQVKIDAIVLGLPPNGYNSSSLLSSWNFNMKPDCATYHAIFPRSWTVYKNPLPDVTVIIRQVSPFLPQNYSDSSLPVCLFHIDIENTGKDDIEASIMFSFQNGDGGDEDAVGDFIHYPYNIDVNNDNNNNGDEIDSNIVEGNKVIHGISMSHHRYYNESIDSSGNHNNKKNRNKNTSNSKTKQIQGSFSIATLTSKTNDDENNTENSKVSYCNQFITHQKLIRCNPLKSFIRRDSIGGKDDEELIDSSAEILWNHFLESGDAISTLNNKISSIDHISTSSSGTKVASAICIRKIVKSKTSTSASFSLAWDHPEVTFGSGTTLPRYYTKFFGKSGLSAANIASYALLNSHVWEDEIVKWQNETIKISENKDSDIPDYYQYHLFNELYYLVDGGTVWTDTHNGTSNKNNYDDNHIEIMGHFDRVDVTIREVSSITKESLIKLSILLKNHNLVCQESQGFQEIIGQFLYLEGHEYLMYNTYDVHFYSGFSILMLFPMLELSIQRDFSASIEMEDLSERRMMGEGNISIRKIKGCVPHDLGSPSEDPWKKTNVYNFQDVSNWKDLGPKFVLQIYRDYYYQNKKFRKDVNISNNNLPNAAIHGFLMDMYPSCKNVMENMLKFDSDDDGMIENSGFPDQTYDIWTAKGVHAYCGGLWIAACLAMSEMATIMDDSSSIVKYEELANKAKKVYVDKLWNGRYLDYDSSDSDHHDSIMADMLAGQWYALSCGLPEVISHEKALSCLNIIYEYNVIKFGNGKLIGAVNGMKPPELNQIDSSCLQSREVWTGTTYALAAIMYLEANVIDKNKKLSIINIDKSHENNDKDHELSSSELKQMAYNTAQGIHDGGWQEFGYWFATPEGWEKNGNYRSLGYMRPLSIWALEYAREL